MKKITVHAVDLQIKTFYNLNGSNIAFPDNPLNGTIYRNADVTISTEKRELYGQTFLVNVVKINNEEPIECELVRFNKDADGIWVLGICQDWG